MRDWYPFHPPPPLPPSSLLSCSCCPTLYCFNLFYFLCLPLLVSSYTEVEPEYWPKRTEIPKLYSKENISCMCWCQAVLSFFRNVSRDSIFTSITHFRTDVYKWSCSYLDYFVTSLSPNAAKRWQKSLHAYERVDKISYLWFSFKASSGWTAKRSVPKNNIFQGGLQFPCVVDKVLRKFLIFVWTHSAMF